MTSYEKEKFAILEISFLAIEIDRIISERLNHFKATAKNQEEDFAVIKRWLQESNKEANRLAQWAQRIAELEVGHITSYELEYTKNMYDNFVYAENEIHNLKMETCFLRPFCYQMFRDYRLTLNKVLNDYALAIEKTMLVALPV